MKWRVIAWVAGQNESADRAIKATQESREENLCFEYPVKAKSPNVRAVVRTDEPIILEKAQDLFDSHSEGKR